jgi:SAM-dependent methyltransferase
MPALPRPPLKLARRVGELDPEDPWGHYERVGALVRSNVDAGLPAGWDWSGKRALDFGCGAGRVLTQYADEAARAELWGCDIDRPSIEWMQRELEPPFHSFLCGETPGLPQADGFFDLIWAASVFTHLIEGWSGWLCELHRVLADDGILIASFLGPGMWAAVGEGEWEEDRIGMCALRAGQPWATGGPTVFHSEWWLREHWGRAFEILSVDRGTEPWNHGWVALRKRAGAVTEAELERVSDDPREVDALSHNLELVHAADRQLRPRLLRITRIPQLDAARWWTKRLRARLRP